MLFPVACSAVVCLLTFTFQQPLQRSKHGCKTALLQFCTQVLHSCTAKLHDCTEPLQNCTASLEHCTEPLHNCTTTPLQSYTSAMQYMKQSCRSALHSSILSAASPRCQWPLFASVHRIALLALHWSIALHRIALEYCTAPHCTGVLHCTANTPHFTPALYIALAALQYRTAALNLYY